MAETPPVPFDGGDFCEAAVKMVGDYSQRWPWPIWGWLPSGWFQKLITLSRQPYLLRAGTKIEHGCCTEFTGYHPPLPGSPCGTLSLVGCVCPSLPCNCLSPELRGHLVTSQSSSPQSGSSFYSMTQESSGSDQWSKVTGHVLRFSEASVSLCWHNRPHPRSTLFSPSGSLLEQVTIATEGLLQPCGPALLTKFPRRGPAWHPTPYLPPPHPPPFITSWCLLISNLSQVLKQTTARWAWVCSQTQFEPAVPARSKSECEKQVTEPGAWELGRDGTSSTLTDRWDSEARVLPQGCQDQLHRLHTAQLQALFI